MYFAAVANAGGAGRARGPLDSRQLGPLLGFHPNTARSHVKQLIEAGLVDAMTAPAVGRGRPRVLYRTVPDGLQPQLSGYRLLAQILAGYLATTDRPHAICGLPARFQRFHETAVTREAKIAAARVIRSDS